MYDSFPPPRLSFSLSLSLSLSLNRFTNSIFNSRTYNIAAHLPEETIPARAAAVETQARNTSGRARSRVTRSGDTNITSRVYLSIGLPIREPDQRVIRSPISDLLSLSLSPPAHAGGVFRPALSNIPSLPLRALRLRGNSASIFTPRKLLGIYRSRADKYHAC